MYKPNDAIASTAPHEIIALVGAPGVGKTTSTLTFPDRVYGDCDHKLPIGEFAVPFHDSAWVEKMGMKKFHPKDSANHRDAVKKWIREELPKFSPEQTFILDSWTHLLAMASQQIWLDDSRLDKPNKYFYWGILKKYCEEMANYLKLAPCRIVTTFHETPERDEEGNLTGKLKPVQDGSYKDQVFSIYTDVWRVVHDMRVSAKDAGGMIKSKVLDGWYWQLQGDSVCDCNCHPSLGPLIRKYGIKYVKFWIDSKGAVQGGFNEIQRIYREENLKVENGILIP